MAKIWLSATQTLNGDGTNIEANGFIKSVQGFKAGDAQITPDGTDVRIDTKGSGDTIWFACGGVDEFKVTNAGGSNV